MAKRDKLLSTYLAELGRKGGKARLKTMSAERRAEIARQAALAGWAKRKPKSKKD